VTAALQALDAQRLSPRQRYAAVLVAFGEFIDGYDLLVMGAALIFIRSRFGLSPGEVGLLGASTFLGAIVGLLVFGDLSDRFGRRAIFVINLAFFVVFALTSAFVDNVWELFAARILVGVGVGMDIPTSTAYLAEIAPRNQRGAVLGSLLNVMWVLGAMTSTLLALPLMALFGDDAWRWMFGLGAVPAFLVLLARRGLPESPRWLISRGRNEEAAAALAQFGIEGAVAPRPEGRGSYGELLRPPWRGRVAWVSLVFFLNCFAGSISTIATPLVFKTVGAFSNTATLLASASVWITALAGTAVSAVLVDRIGRRTLALISTIPFGLTALALALFGQAHPVVLVGGFYLLSFSVWMGIGVLVWVWGSELFPTRLRGRSQGVCNGWCRLAIASNIFVAPIALSTVGFSVYVGLLALPMFAIAIIVWRVDLFETTGLELEALEAS
jgi:putative MFS transporter